MEAPALILVGLVIAVGLVGIAVPVLPGLLLIWGAVLVWALVERSTVAWVVLGLGTAVAACSQVVKYLVPGQRMRRAGVPQRTILLGGLAGVVGFFVVPVVGLVLGFVAGVYAAERARLGSHDPAWASTVHALKAVGLSILIELFAGLVLAGAWLAAVGWG